MLRWLITPSVWENMSPLDRDSRPSTSQLVGDVAAVDGGILFASQPFLKVSEGGEAEEFSYTTTTLLNLCSNCLQKRNCFLKCPTFYFTSLDRVNS